MRFIAFAICDLLRFITNRFLSSKGVTGKKFSRWATLDLVITWRNVHVDMYILRVRGIARKMAEGIFFAHLLCVTALFYFRPHTIVTFHLRCRWVRRRDKVGFCKRDCQNRAWGVIAIGTAIFGFAKIFSTLAGPALRWCIWCTCTHRFATYPEKSEIFLNCGAATRAPWEYFVENSAKIFARAFGAYLHISSQVHRHI